MAVRKKCSFCGACEEEGTRCSAEPLPEPKGLVIRKWWHGALLVLLLLSLGRMLRTEPAHAETAGPTDLARITKAVEQIPVKLDKLAEACRK